MLNQKGDSPSKAKRTVPLFLENPQQKWMKLAIGSARKGIKKSEGGPFGAAIVRENKIVAIAHNTVLKNNDATCHAEINAIRIASKKFKRFDLSDCVIYSTTEPCPMCFSAIHWARIAKVIFGTSFEDVAKRGFNELYIPSRKMKRDGRSQVRISSGFMKKECLALLADWDRQSNKRIY